MWFFRVVEVGSDRWECRRGTTVLDTHATAREALDHISAVAAEHRPATVFLHLRDGGVRKLGEA